MAISILYKFYSQEKKFSKKSVEINKKLSIKNNIQKRKYPRQHATLFHISLQK